MAGKWSIATKEPAGAPAASIGESDGKATFPANTSTTTDNVYTITYTDDNGCVETTEYTVKKCVPSCTCTASAGGNVQCEASTSLISVGSYTSNNCSGSWSATHKSGANFLYDFSFSNGTISAKVQQGSTTSTQSGTYTIGIDNCTHDVTFTQEKCASICKCEDLGLSVSQVSWDPSETNSQTVTITSASCVTNIRVNCDNSHFSVSLGSGSITIAPSGQNTSAEEIIGTVTVSYNTDCTKTITLYHNIIEFEVVFTPEIDYLGASEGWHAHWLSDEIPSVGLTVGDGWIGYTGKDCDGHEFPTSMNVAVTGLNGRGRIISCAAGGVIGDVYGPDYDNLGVSFSYNGVAKSIQSGDETEVIIGPNLERVKFSI